MMTRRAAVVPLLPLLFMGSACTITIGPYDDTGGAAPQKTSVLPAPKGGAVDEPPLDEAQQARLEETEQYTAEVIYKGGEILQAIQLPSGDVLDFIKRDTLPALPYELPALPFAPEDLVLPEGVELGLTELEQSTELLELAAMATPFHRPVSVLGGTQVEHLMAIFQVPWGDWWITYNGDFLGYYPASLFTMLNKGACGSAWYGEVFNPTPGTAIGTEMGSGKFAEAGLLNAAYVRNPKFHDLSLFGVIPEDNASEAPYNPLCYDRSPLWDGVFLLGGPGGNSPGCKWP